MQVKPNRTLKILTGYGPRHPDRQARRIKVKIYREHKGQSKTMASSSNENNLEKLTDAESYKFWKFQSTVLFKAQGIYEIVTGESKYDTLIEDKAKTEWVRKDALAQKVIVTSVDKQFLVHILNDTTSHAMYTKLCSLFEREAEQQKCALLQEFFNYKFNDDQNMTNFLSNLQNMAFKLKSLNQNIDDDMLMSKILSSLPEQFKHFITAWDSTSKEEKSLTNLTTRLLAEESRFKNNNENNMSLAFKTGSEKFKKFDRGGTHDRPNKSYRSSTKPNFDQRSKTVNNVNSSNVGSRKCFICDRAGHFANSCPNKSKNQSSGKRLFCKICKKTNHEDKDCYFRPTNKFSNDKSKLSFLTYSEFDKSKHVTQFVVDSGCTTHMTNDETLFSTLDFKQSEVHVAKNKETMTAIGEGKVEGREFNLNKVLYVPDLSTNLFSVKAVTENDGEVTFTKDRVVISKNGKMVSEGVKQPNGLYTINVKPESRPIGQSSKTMLTGYKDKPNAMDWHSRLGHLNVSYMKKLIRQNLVDGMELSEKDCEEIEKNCDVCLKAKQTRFPFNEERKRAERPLQIIHTDLCGPIDPSTWDGKKYILTLMDDYTHFVVVRLLSNKNEAFKFIKEYVLEAEAQHNLQVSRIRCDNGGEYRSKEMQDWCKNRGIQLSYTEAYTPEHNGKAERLNRTLIEKARALLYDTETDKKFWGEAVRTSAYLLNRSPTEAVDVTPAEKWFGRKPDVSRLRKFGCEAHVKIVRPIRKLDPRSEIMKFIGYAENGYRMWSYDKQRIITARDVIFDERGSRPKSDSGKIGYRLEHENQEDDLVSDNNSHEETDEENHEENNEMNLENQAQEMEEEIRPRRQRRPPRRFQDYAMLTFREAISSPEKREWIKAIEEEKKSLMKNNTWNYIDVEEADGKRILSNKWIFSKKEDGRFKARLVVRGCEQKSDFNYDEIFSPVVSSNSLRIMFAIATLNDYHILKFDIKTAFLYGDIQEEIFMQVPEGFNEPNKVCKLNKALYGLKQAPVTWNRKFTQVLNQKGLEPTMNEKCIFKNEDGSVVLALYVDDGILIGKDKEELEKILKELKREFEVKEDLNPNSFLGIEIQRTKAKIKLTQEKYSKNLLHKFNMENSKFVATPSEIKTSRSGKPVHSFPFRESVGSLLYLSTRSRPDIAHSVNVCSRHLEDPVEEDIVSVKRVMKYLVGTTHEGISYIKDSDKNLLEAYCDADYAGDEETRRSTSGYVILYAGGPIAWCSRRQPIVALSSTEAEYIAAADCCKELLYLKSLIQEITNIPLQVKLYVDNQSAISLMKTGVMNKRSKHIDVRYHFIHEKIVSGEINVEYCPTNNQIADILTKPLCKVKFNYFKEIIVQ